MPTGYTAGVKFDTKFEDFAWKCARAFGALILMRDEPNDAVVPQEFQPETFYRDNSEKSEARVAEVRGWTDEQAAADLAAKIAADRATTDKLNAESVELRNAYNRMLALTMEWTPPSPDHVAMKDFMIQQLTSSREFDAHDYQYHLKPVPPSEWKAKQLQHAEEQLARDRQSWANEQARTADRNTWLRQLRESLAETVKA